MSADDRSSSGGVLGNIFDTVTGTGTDTGTENGTSEAPGPDERLPTVREIEAAYTDAPIEAVRILQYAVASNGSDALLENDVWEARFGDWAILLNITDQTSEWEYTPYGTVTVKANHALVFRLGYLVASISRDGTTYATITDEDMDRFFAGDSESGAQEITLHEIECPTERDQLLNALQARLDDIGADYGHVREEDT